MSNSPLVQAVSLPHSALNRLMPFHLIIDESGTVVSAGSSIIALLESKQILGASLFDLVTIHNNYMLTSYQQCQAHIGKKIRVRSKTDTPVELWGELVLLEQPDDYMLFDLLPSLNSHAKRLLPSLNPSHYPAADLTNELLALVEMQKAILDRANDLNNALAEQTKSAKCRADLLSATLELLTNSLETSRWTLSYTDANNDQSVRNIGFKTHGHIHALLESGIFLAQDIVRWVEALPANNGISIIEICETNEEQFSVEISDNQERYWTLVGATLDSGGRSLICMDVSKFKHREKSRAQRDRMEALGRLTNGVAHDFNNLLAIISSGIQVLDATLEPNNSTLKLIDNAVIRAARLVRQLVDYVKVPDTNLEPTLLSDAINDLIPIAELALGHMHSLIVESDCNLAITCTPELLTTTLLNLITNARDAMVNGGTIKIVIRESNPQECSHHKLSSSNVFAAIDIIDEGTGIDSQISCKIYEPFFSTKRRESGSGLGLSIVYNFASGVGGAVAHKANNPNGTIMTMLIPSIRNKSTTTRPSNDAEMTRYLPPETLHQNKRVLLIDDEGALADLIAAQLDIIGIKSQTLVSVSALRDFLERESNPSWDLVLTDYYLTDGTAKDVIELCKQTAVTTKFIVMSGNHQVMESSSDNYLFLAKPFTFSELREALDNKL